MRDINQVVIHSADTPNGVYFDSKDIRKWHVEERGWSDIGYHYIILLDGTIELGRPVERAGAHVGGHNKNTIGVCYIGGGNGKDTRTCEQKESLIILIKFLKKLHKNPRVLGHRDFKGVTKKCPCFDAIKEYEYIN